MAQGVEGFSNKRTYFGDAQIDFITEERGLSVTIETPRLFAKSLTKKEYRDYVEIFGDRVVMAKYGDGKPKTEEEATKRVNDRSERWEKRDPYSDLSIHDKYNDKFLGWVVLGRGDAPGESELAYMFHHRCWRQGFGNEAVGAVVKEYAPATVSEGYLMEGKPLEKIVATARPDNPASCKILDNVGMKVVRQGEGYGAIRNYYELVLNPLKKPQVDEAKV